MDRVEGMGIEPTSLGLKVRSITLMLTLLLFRPGFTGLTLFEFHGLRVLVVESVGP